MGTTAAKLEIEAGLLLRRSVRVFLEQQRFRHTRITIKYKEIKSVLGSIFLIDISGESLFVDAWKSATKDLIYQWKERLGV